MDQNNNQNPKNNRNNGPGGPKNRQTLLMLLICILISLACMSFFGSMQKDLTSREISYNEFISMVDKNEISKVQLKSDTLTIIPKKQ